MHAHHLSTSLLDACTQVRARVEEVLAQVDLTERYGDLVGSGGTNGLPTEARKRLTIAVELMANPPGGAVGLWGCAGGCAEQPQSVLAGP